MSGRSGARRPGRCIYCGAKVKGGRACTLHRGLLYGDPSVGGARRVTTERELGVTDQHALGELEGREELG